MKGEKKKKESSTQQSRIELSKTSEDTIMMNYTHRASKEKKKNLKIEYEKKPKIKSRNKTDLAIDKGELRRTSLTMRSIHHPVVPSKRWPSRQSDLLQHLGYRR